jgi:hypothetical protein
MRHLLVHHVFGGSRKLNKEKSKRHNKIYIKQEPRNNSWMQLHQNLKY